MHYKLSWLVGSFVTIVMTVAVILAVAGRPDEARSLSSGEDIHSPGKVVTSDDRHYSFFLPATWYLERNNAQGITMYPEYMPNAHAVPLCKIEVSTVAALSMTAASLHDWLSGYLHADPTAEVTEFAQASTTIAGVPAISWRGVWNGATTTLVYIATHDSVLEVAPSIVSEDMHTDGACDMAMATFLSKLSLTP
jgi:hypothetical protein